MAIKHTLKKKSLSALGLLKRFEAHVQLPAINLEELREIGVISQIYF